MKVRFPIFSPSLYQLCYEGEGGSGDGGAATETPPSEPTAQPGSGEKTYTEAEFNNAMAKTRKEATAKSQKHLSDLRELQTKYDNKSTEYSELQTRIETMESELMTADERAAKAKAEAEKKHAAEIDKVRKEADSWESRYRQETASRAIMDAASNEKAVNAGQMVGLYGSRTELVRDVDSEGNFTNSYTPMMEFEGIDDDNKTVTMKLPVAEAMKKLKEDGLNANLFQNTTAPGTGSSPGQGSRSGKQTGAEPRPEDFGSREEYTAAYMSWRKEHNIDGSAKG